MAKKATRGDARTIRSKKELALALESLLQEQDFTDISIKDIAERALVSKNTFYNNFDEKADLLDNLFDRYLDELKSLGVVEPNLPPLEKTYVFNRVIARFICEHAEKFHQMVLCDKSRSLYWSLLKGLQHIMVKELRLYNYSLTDNHAEMESNFFAGGSANLVYCELAKEPSHLSEQGMVELFDSLWQRILTK